MMKDHMKMLARKGNITIVEHAGEKTTVAIQPFSGAGVVTLQGWTTKDQLLAELCQMCQNWPDGANEQEQP